MFHVWDEESQGHTRADAKAVIASDVAQAAESYAEKRAAQDEWPPSWDLLVESPQGQRFKVHVSVEMVPKYHATVETPEGLPWRSFERFDNGVIIGFEPAQLERRVPERRWYILTNDDISYLEDGGDSYEHEHVFTRRPFKLSRNEAVAELARLADELARLANE